MNWFSNTFLVCVNFRESDKYQWFLRVTFILVLVLLPTSADAHRQRAGRQRDVRHGFLRNGSVQRVQPAVVWPQEAFIQWRGAKATAHDQKGPQNPGARGPEGEIIRGTFILGKFFYDCRFSTITLHTVAPYVTLLVLVLALLVPHEYDKSSEDFLYEIKCVLVLLQDEKYWTRRYKNNEAAKRSRDARRLKENQISVRAAYLERENAALRQEVAEMRKELGRCRSILSKYENRLADQ